MQDDQASESLTNQTTLYVKWLSQNRELISSAQITQYPYLYRMLIANHDALRIFLIAVLDILIRDTANMYTHRLPDQHGCIPIELTEKRLKEKLKYKGMEFSQGSQEYTWDVHDKLIMLHAFWLIKRVITPVKVTATTDHGQPPKYLFSDLYTPNHLMRVEDRVRRWAIVTGRRKRLSKDDIIWLYGQRDADLVFIPSTRSETDASLEATDRFITAYRSAKASKHNSQPVTISDVSYQLRRLYNQDTAKIRDTIHRAKIPLFMEYGLQNRQMTAEEKSQYGITDRTYWAIMPVPEEIIEEMRDKRTYWEQEEEPDGELIF